MSISSEIFGYTKKGQTVYTVCIKSKELKVKIITYGARIRRLKYMGTEMVYGFYGMGDYERDCDYHGAIVGRYANRIAGAEFTLDSKNYKLDKNDGENHLHGGNSGFSQRNFEICDMVPTEDGGRVTLSLFSEDMDGGYPGNIDLRVTYTLSGSTLMIDYAATTDKPTYLNLTNHSYFNPSGVGSTVRDVILKTASANYAPSDKELIPFGYIEAAKGALDFTKAKPVCEALDSDDAQIVNAGGIDHCFESSGSFERASAGVYSPTTGIMIEMFTTEPAMQIYSGNFMGTKEKMPDFRGHIKQQKQTAICMESGIYPNTPNNSFGGGIITPEKAYSSATKYVFSKKSDFSW